MLDWLIIGGGIHGTYLSHYLLNRKGVCADRVRVLDPHAVPLARWTHLATNTGMRYLRSSRVHHLDLTASSLERFFDAAPYYPPFLGDYRRPAYSLFQDHAAATITCYGLADLRIRGEACGIKALPEGFAVDTTEGVIAARRVALAIGRTDLHYPEWAPPLCAAGAPLFHIFDMGFRRDELPDDGQVVVIGGGITAAQTALALANRPAPPVILMMRHEIRVHNFDAAPGWMGPKELDKFRKKDFARRRVLITRARNRGSMPPDVYADLRTAILAGRIRLMSGNVCQVTYHPGLFTLSLEDGEKLEGGIIVLATGFEMQRPGGVWLSQTIDALGLRCAGCGYPIVDTRLQWSPGLFVSGALAELQVGPVAANLIGARMAAERIARA